MVTRNDRPRDLAEVYERYTPMLVSALGELAKKGLDVDPAQCLDPREVREDLKRTSNAEAASHVSCCPASEIEAATMARTMAAARASRAARS